MRHGDLLSCDKWRASHHTQPNRLPYAFILIAARDAKCLPRGPNCCQRGLAACICHYFLLDKEGNAALWDFADDGSRLCEWQSITHWQPWRRLPGTESRLTLSYFSSLFRCLRCLHCTSKSLWIRGLSGCCWKQPCCVEAVLSQAVTTLTHFEKKLCVWVSRWCTCSLCDNNYVIDM